MALTKNIEFKGISVAGAYIKVIKVEGDKTSMLYTIGFSASALSPVFTAETFELTGFSLEGDNIIKQAYEHLKTLPEFVNAVDV